MSLSEILPKQRVLNPLLFITTFKQLLDEIRQELAVQYLGSSRRLIIEISYLLGFSEPSNFTRAFKRWKAVSPYQYRQEL